MSFDEAGQVNAAFSGSPESKTEAESHGAAGSEVPGWSIEME